MLIHEMTLEECRDALAQASLARLACEMDGQPYAVPVYLVYDGNYLFGFSTMGYKIDCMRTNPLVCVEIDDVKSQNEWMSVLMFGSYEELPDRPENKAARAHAHELLQKRAMWWEPACVAVTHRDHPKSLTPIFYRIVIDRMTGHRASPDVVEVPPAPPAKARSGLNRFLDRVLPK
jgi:nitroimidazol reductase NimA-like FMN-containing flavoprotein (pyridoxamine 5'-phosphate oxidase superfamily)